MFYVIRTKMIKSYGRQALVPWLRKVCFYQSSRLTSMFSGMKRLGSGWSISSSSPPLSDSLAPYISQVSLFYCVERGTEI